MIIKCRVCDYEMGLPEFLTYAEAYLIKTLVVAVAIPLLIAMMHNKFSTPTRGFVDGTMAGLANNFSVACPNCKKVDEPWYPGMQQKPKTVRKKSEKKLNKKTATNSESSVAQ